MYMCQKIQEISLPSPPSPLYVMPEQVCFVEIPALRCLVRINHFVSCSVLQCVAVCCSALQCAALCCSALQCIAVRCSALQCVAVRCSALQCVAMWHDSSICRMQRRPPSREDDAP